MSAKRAASEADFQTACTWWPDLPDIWTPVGWKDHLFRFNVLWNGTVIAQPFLNRRTERWKTQGAQFAFAPSLTGRLVDWRDTCLRRDDGIVTQGWQDGRAPVLWTEWPTEGVLLRQEVFGHIPGGKDVVTGVEPLFAWVRLSIHDVCKALPLEETHGFLVRINAPCFHTSMGIRGHRFDEPQPGYPRRLRAVSSRRDFRLVEGKGRVRLAALKRKGCTVELRPRKRGEKDVFLHIRMPAKVGTSVDMLIPMLPADRGVFNAELSLGRDRALRQANRYWSRRPRAAARVHTPEPQVNDIIRHSLRLSEVISERNPADGQCALLSGSYTYANLWTTPHAMNCIMLLDTLGYHEVVDRHLEIFRNYQGSVTPPGDFFRPHPGYLSTPRTLTSVDWLSDHGAILYTAAEHALLSQDKRFVGRWVDAIERACDFIAYARGITGHGGVEGVMPPAVATDRMTKIQAVWNDGWNYKGLVTAVRLLRRIGHPRASEFAAEAADYRRCFRRAFRAKAATLPKWTDDRGKKHPFAPTALSGDTKEETRHPFYLDTGPLFLVYAGLVDANDVLMRSSLLWFREGPAWKLHRHDSNCGQVPVLDHEISTCEPCYSWNVFHPHRTGDRVKFLEGMYSLFAGSVSRKTQVSCETRGGITGNVFSAPLPIYMARLSVIDDQLREDELHLLRLVPRAWLRSDHETIFEKMPTEFGPVSLHFRLSPGGAALHVSFRPEYRVAPARVVLHVPPVDGLKRVVVNGRALKARRGAHVL